MTGHEPKSLLAYWLVPAEPARSFFVSAIADLAARFDAPRFEPHLTVSAGPKGNENPEEVLRGAFADCEPFRLSVRDVQCSDEFTKTVFMQFEPSLELLRLNRALQEASALHDDYEFNPHLSLIYKNMTPEARMEVATSIRVPFTEVLFDSAKAVVCPTPIRSRADVEAWRVVATQSLTK
jgi:2'-5' RNA ligase